MSVTPRSVPGTGSPRGPPANQAPFKRGTALVTASMTVCDGFVPCHTATNTEEVTFRR